MEESVSENLVLVAGASPDLGLRVLACELAWWAAQGLLLPVPQFPYLKRRDGVCYCKVQPRSNTLTLVPDESLCHLLDFDPVCVLGNEH